MGRRKRKAPESDEESASKGDSDSEFDSNDGSDEDSKGSESDFDPDKPDSPVRKARKTTSKKAAVSKKPTPKASKASKTPTKASAAKSKATPKAASAKKRVKPTTAEDSAAKKAKLFFESTKASAATPKVTKTPAKSSASSTKKTPAKKTAVLDLSDKPDSYEVTIPPHLLNGGTSSSNAPCLVMVQVDPKDAAGLDFEGVSGAIGRFEANAAGIVLDVKGCQYQGSILPGPTAMVAGFTSSTGFGRTNGPTRLHVEGITDEFATLVKTNDSMLQLDAIVKGEMDASFQVQDENVNRASGKKDKDK